VALLEARGFTPEDFAFSHPGGALGRRLLLTVESLMQKDARLPQVKADVPLTAALLEMTQKGLGMTAITDADGIVQGVFTDGDLRRVLDAGTDVRNVSVGSVMTPGGKRIAGDALAAEAVQKMEASKITALMVCDDTGRLRGVIHLQDLLRAGVV
jgi:arabinose-5-phosphate isomerase